MFPAIKAPSPKKKLELGICPWSSLFPPDSVGIVFPLNSFQLASASESMFLFCTSGTVLPSGAGIYFISDYLLQKMENRRKKLQSRTTLEHVA